MRTTPVPLFLPHLLLTACIPQATPAERIIDEVTKRGHAMADLAFLSDEIGARLTGSPSLARAENWAATKMREYGAENVHLESYTFPSQWERGTDDFAQLTTQSKRQMTVHAMAWNPPTKGLIEADVALLEGTIDDLTKHIERFNGKIVVLSRLIPGKDQAAFEKGEKALYKKLGPRVKALIGSFEHEDGKFTMFGSPYDSYFDEFFGGWPRVPFGFLTVEDRRMVSRLLRKGDKVRMKLRLGGKITQRNVVEHNVVGEIRGSEKPEEVVIVGGHLDSWDLGTGTTDNGTGAIAALEALRAMRTLGVRPKRTIRFVLFSGEEQGLCGSEAYVKAHASELKNIQAVLIDDIGAGKPTGFTIQGHKEWEPLLRKAMTPAESLGAKNIPPDTHWDSDQDPFVLKGVPGFFMDQDVKDYVESTHHSQTDMFDHVKKEDYLSGVAAFAVVSWEIAHLAERIPHIAPGHLVGP